MGAITKSIIVGEENIPTPGVDALRDSMKQLLDMILGFFEAETQKVDAGRLALEQTLLNDVQEDNPNTLYSPRPVLENFSPQGLRSSL